MNNPEYDNTAFTNTIIKIVTFEKSLSQIEDLCKKIESRILYLDQKIDNFAMQIEKRLWTNFLWLVGFGIGLYGSLFAILAHSFKWF